jgi:hypothetical protein
MNNSSSTHSPVQLTLLPRSERAGLPGPQLPARFLLSRQTRERGLRHVAEIREMLAASHPDMATNPSGTPHRPGRAA